MAAEKRTPDDGADNEVKFTPPSFALKAKAPPSKNDLGSILLEADQGIADMSKDYLDYARDDARRLGAACDELESSGGAKEAIETAYWIAHQMKGQGGTFGYPLITAVGASLCDLLDGRESLDAAQVQAARLHFEAMSLVVSRPLKGDDGEGAKMVEGLLKVAARASRASGAGPEPE